MARPRMRGTRRTQSYIHSCLHVRCDCVSAGKAAGGTLRSHPSRAVGGHRGVPGRPGLHWYHECRRGREGRSVTRRTAASLRDPRPVGGRGGRVSGTEALAASTRGVGRPVPPGHASRGEAFSESDRAAGGCARAVGRGSFGSAVRRHPGTVGGARSHPRSASPVDPSRGARQRRACADLSHLRHRRPGHDPAHPRPPARQGGSAACSPPTQATAKNRSSPPGPNS